MSRLLEIRGLTKRFQGVVANEDVDLDLEEGQIAAVIGPNGAGKTTLISMISGHLTPTAGRLMLHGQDVTSLSVVHRARLGISRKFQTPSVFPKLTVWENIELAVIASRRRQHSIERRVGEVIELVRLSSFVERLVFGLSHGQRQWLEIGLLLGNDAELLLLDEPTAGMTAAETKATGVLIRSLAEQLGIAAIIIEHDVNFIRDLRSRVTVLHLGRVFASGSFDEIANDDRVRSIYLGRN
jgi:ABC-type uncharacterized transport system ATPase subunit